MKDIAANLGSLQGKVRDQERYAMQIRSFAKLKPCERLDPYELADKLGLKVVTIKEISGIEDITARRLLLEKANEWSGASSFIQTDNSNLIILNSSQSQNRNKATLMEEICHILLGHKKTRVSANLTGARDYLNKIETEAYNVGAAALVPFIGLQFLLSDGLNSRQIARNYQVSLSLVHYRIKLLRSNTKT